MPTQQSTSPVEFIRPEVYDSLGKWELIRACIAGESAVKALGDKLLPRPNPADTTPANQARYASYLMRSVFYGVTGRTLRGLVGYVFAKEPAVNLPETMASLEKNIDGSGVTLNQQAKAALQLLLSLGRGGLLVDYPVTDSPTTKQDLLEGNVAPTIILYEPEQITNWRTSAQGAKVFLDLLVLKESAPVADSANEFSTSFAVRYRVLTRTQEGVQGRIFSKANGKETFEEDQTLRYEPKDNAGNRLKEIPFVFLGAENNDEAVDSPPLLDLATLNVAHYRNSADHEEACYMVGQPTPYMSGLTESWVNDVLKGSVYLGSRTIIPLPQGGQAGLLQAQSNTLPFEAMKHKELQMVALGAKLVEQSDVQRTATEASMEHAGEVSTLTACATNVFLGYKKALEFAAAFVGTEAAGIEYDLSEPLSMQSVTAEQASAIMSLFVGGLIDYEEARYQLRRAGWAWKDDNVARDNADAGNFDNKPPTTPPGGQPPAPAQ